MSIIVKILLAAALALGVGNVWQWVAWGWSVKGLKGQIAQLEQEKATLNMTVEKQAAELNIKEAQAKAKRKVRHVEKKTDEIVGAGDDAAMRRLFVERGMLQATPAGAAGMGGKGGPERQPATPPRAAPLH